VGLETGEKLFAIAPDLQGGAQRPVAGDWCACDGDGQIRAVLPRRGLLERRAAGPVDEGQILASHVDLALILIPLEADLRLRRLDRYLALCAGGDVEPVVLLSKADLVSNPEEAAEAVGRAYPTCRVIAFSSVAGQGLDDLRALLSAGRSAVLLGSSGVGKSTLANTLAGREVMQTGEVRGGDGKGRHTTSHRELILLPSGGMLLDTPGLREVGLWVDAASVDAVFEDLAEMAQSCRFGDCRHQGEPGCALRQSVDDGDVDEDRLDSYLKLRAEADLAAIRKEEHLRRDLEKKTHGRWRKEARYLRDQKGDD
jgi:ribosome biogenesis GTPase